MQCVADRRQRVAQLVREHRQELVGLALGLLQRFDALAVGKVAHLAGIPVEHALLIIERRHYDVHPKRRAVLAHADAFVFEAALLARHRELLLGPFIGERLLRVEAREMLAERLFRFVAHHALGAEVPAHDVAAAVEKEDRIVPDALN